MYNKISEILRDLKKIVKKHSVRKCYKYLIFQKTYNIEVFLQILMIKAKKVFN